MHSLDYKPDRLPSAEPTDAQSRNDAFAHALPTEFLDPVITLVGAYKKGDVFLLEPGVGPHFPPPQYR